MKLLWVAVVVWAGGSSTKAEGGPRFEGVSLADSTLVRFVSDFAGRARWDSVVFFFSNSSEFSKALTPLIFTHFNAEGKFVALHTTSRPLLPRSLLHHRHRLGVVYFCELFQQEFLSKVSELDLFDSYRSWLIVSPDKKTSREVREVLKGLHLDLVTDLVLATLERRAATATRPPGPHAPATPPGHLVGYRKRDVGARRPRLRKGDLAGDPELVVHLAQLYKVSRTENETLGVRLGLWDAPSGMLKAREPLSLEKKWDLGGHKITVGVRNSTLDIRDGSMVANKFSTEAEADEEFHFMELFNCLMFGVNASFELVQFQKLGWKNEEGGWTHLLGSVVDGNVDFALETIDQNSDKTQDMSFTYAILITMNNIYFRRPKSGGLRDIFLAPFSPRLLACVLATSFLLALAMISITVVNQRRLEAERGGSALRVLGRGRRQRSVAVASEEVRKWEVSEAALWSVSVLCMQGSQWSPKSASGSLLLINGLLFALIIYNSFAAFITSVLSVKDAKIKDLKDMAKSDFAFGYTLGNSDELFLRTVNDTLLRELYFKGLRENDGVSDPIVGMHRAAEGGYAFFVGARTARRALRTVVAHDRRCDLQELYLPVTKNYASIPVTRKSPLKKILNHKIIRVMESGLLHRFRKLILPSMPQCVDKTAFNSARLADVYSAFFVLIVGWITSLLIFASEILWHKREKIKAKPVPDPNLKFYTFQSQDATHLLK